MALDPWIECIVVSNGATLPIGFRWIRNGVSITNGMQVLNSYTCFFTITNAQPPFTSYRVVVTNSPLFIGRSSFLATLTFLTDTNSNGLADSWEREFFPGGGTVDPDADPDHDGLTNLQEYIAGTDPNLGASFLKIDILSAGTGATLQFGAFSNRTYTVLSSSILDGPWSKLTDVFALATNRVETVLDPGSATNRFYRVVTPRRP